MTYVPHAAGDDAPVHQSPVLPAEDARTVLINTVSWGAVFAGVAVALTTHALLNLAGLSLGLSLLEPAGRDTPDAESLGIGAGLWTLIAGIVAAFCGGAIAGRLSGRPKESTCGWHGVTSWAVSTLVVLFLATSTVGAAVGGMAAATGLGVASADGGMAAIAEQTPLGRIEARVRQATAGGSDPAALQEAAVGAVSSALVAEEGEATAARDRAVEALARAQAIPLEEARSRYDALETEYREQEAAARAAADAAAEVGARIAIFACAALVLGGVAAWFGGRLGTVRPTITPL